MPSYWRGVDFHGTLSVTDHTARALDETVTGPPTVDPETGKPEMVLRVKRWIQEGVIETKIFTSALTHAKDPKAVKGAIDSWCIKYIGQALPITNEKDEFLLEIWDDKAVAVERNTGRILGRNY